MKRVSEPEIRLTDIIPSKQREKKNPQRWHKENTTTNISSNLNVTNKKKEKTGTEKKNLKKIIAENVPKLVNKANTQTQEVRKLKEDKGQENHAQTCCNQTMENKRQRRKFTGVSIVAQQKKTWLVARRMRVWSLASFSGLGIRCCHEPWCRSQTRLRFHFAVTAVQASDYSSNSTPSPGTSIFRGP